MKQNKASSRIAKIVKSACAGALLPVLFIYIMIAKPDYRIMNNLAHVVLPVANWVGNVISWPIRAVGNVAENIHQMANLKIENEELKTRLYQALQDKQACDIAVMENKKLENELGVVKAQSKKTVVADIIHDTSAFNHSTFFINKGVGDGLEVGMVVLALDGKMVGVISDVAPHFAQVRALADSNTNIAVRIVGSEVYGFLRGNGSERPVMGFFSDPEFQPSGGIKLVTSNISGVLPAGLPVGEMINETEVDVLKPSKLSRVMVVHFDKVGIYK